MIEYNGMRLDTTTVELATAPSPYKGYGLSMRSKTFYHQHELAIWSALVMLLLASFWLILANNADLLWDITTPLTKVLP